MSVFKQLVISLACAALIFGLFSWPLYTHMDEGIPYTTRRGEETPVRHMVMGDHLQLLFHFWLADEWISGTTPFGYNPYIFNIGDDTTGACPVTDYLPYSGIFALLNGPFSRAASWNLTILFSLWMSHFFILRFLGIYGATTRISTLLGMVVVSMPYQWSTLFGGSPTGFAMMCIPMLLYGLEKALRYASVCGGLIAALALLMAFWTDTHILLFSLMLGPAWGLLILLHDEKFKVSNPKDLFLRIGAASPLFVMALIAMIQRLKTKASLGDTVIGAGRDWREVALFSPHLRGFFQPLTTGHDHTVYIGIFMAILVALGIVISMITYARERNVRRIAHLLLLSVGIIAIALFALGTNGPQDGIVLRIARKILPPMGMIRQPAKVFGILAPLFALLALPVWKWAADGPRAKWLKLGLPLLLCIVGLIDYRWQIKPGICIVNTEQQAYAAVVKDAEKQGITARAIVIPIWPGDSAWASIYQHDASLYRLRLMNGYLPVVAREYIETIYKPLDSMNSGMLNDEQIEFLKSRGFDYVLFQEDAFPEQVSWFPAGYTLRKLLTHPNLELMRQDGSVWAFRLVQEKAMTPRDSSSAVSEWNVFGSRIQSEMEHEHLSGKAAVMDDDSASAGRFVRLEHPEDSVSLSPFDHLEPEQPVIMMRVRGRSIWKMMVQDGDTDVAYPQTADTETWMWVTFPLYPPFQSQQIRPYVLIESGSLDVDRMAYVSGVPPSPRPGDEIFIPASVLFHAGYSDLETSSVVFRITHEPGVRILYGPRWPLPPGVYEAEPVWVSPLSPGVSAGEFNVLLGNEFAGSVTLTGGKESLLRFSTIGRDLPLEFGFYYFRTVDLALKGIRINRIE